MFPVRKAVFQCSGLADSKGARRKDGSSTEYDSLSQGAARAGAVLGRYQGAKLIWPCAGRCCGQDQPLLEDFQAAVGNTSKDAD